MREVVININTVECKPEKVKQTCLWDNIEETHPWSWIKIALLVCTCPKCNTIKFN